MNLFDFIADPDPLFLEVDPRIRINIKMKRTETLVLIASLGKPQKKVHPLVAGPLRPYPPPRA